MFQLKQDTRKLSDVQRFSKLYHCYYGEGVSSKWRETYLDHYKRVTEDLTLTDATEIEKQVIISIKNDLEDGLLDMAVAATSCVEGNEGEEGVPSDEASNEASNEDSNEDSNEASVNLPKVGIWYRNAVMRELWKNATPSQRYAIEQHKKKEDEKKAVDGPKDEMGDDDNPQHKVKRLRGVIELVTPDFVPVTL